MVTPKSLSIDVLPRTRFVSGIRGKHMTERYSVAAERHHRVAVRLEADGETDDAAYHYGLVGENALKYGLFKSGVAQAWDSGGIKRTNTPMGKHFPKLTPIIRDLIADIRLFASGRIGAQIQSVVDDSAFAGRFQGWSIDIRYADDQCTPVDPADCARWAQDAELFLWRLVLMV